jgi:hypothetical protein
MQGAKFMEIRYFLQLVVSELQPLEDCSMGCKGRQGVRPSRGPGSVCHPSLPPCTPVPGVRDDRHLLPSHQRRLPAAQLLRRPTTSSGAGKAAAVLQAPAVLAPSGADGWPSGPKPAQGRGEPPLTQVR